MYPIYQTTGKNTGEEAVIYRRGRFFPRFYTHWFILCFILSLFVSFFISLEFYSYSEQESSRNILYRSFLLKQIFSQYLDNKNDFRSVSKDYQLMRSLTQAYEFSPDLSFVDLFYTQGFDAYRSLFSHNRGDNVIPESWTAASRMSLYNKTRYWTLTQDGFFIVGVSLGAEFKAPPAQFVFVWEHRAPEMFSSLFLIEMLTSFLITLALSVPGVYFILPSAMEVLEKRRLLGTKNLENARRRLRSAQTKLLHLEVES